MGSRTDATRRLLARLSLLAMATLVLLPFLWKLDGQSHADWQQLIGRFHPLAVHLPIGMLLLVPLLEIRGFSHPALREAAGFILGLTVLATIGTVALGYLLAFGSGTTGATLTYHMWGGISLAIGVLVCFLIRPRWIAGEFPLGYPIALACVLLLLLWTCHQGGSLTHGENYLTEWLPAEFKRLTGITNEPEKEQLVADSFYALQIRPILDANCYACHSRTKVKGGLRLDSYARLMRGGRSGAVIVPGRPDQSSLFKRITLPPDDKKFMPSEGKPPLKPEQITWIKAWIAAGASDAATTVAGVTLPARRKTVPTAAGGRLQRDDGSDCGAREDPIDQPGAGVEEFSRRAHTADHQRRPEIQRCPTRAAGEVRALYCGGEIRAHQRDRCLF